MRLSLNRLLLIERREVTQDANYGTDIVTWTPIAVESGSPEVPIYLWAEVQDVMPSRVESLKQGQAIARNQTRVRMRWRGDIDSGMRVKIGIPYGTIPWGSNRWWTDEFRVYQIVGGPAEIGGRKKFIEFMLEQYGEGE